MGFKRKASELEESLVHNASYPHIQHPSTPSLTFSPASSTTTTITPPNNHPSPFNSWNFTAVPYMNSRTLKRYRDGRPDEGQIHDNTLKKLYDAQRLHLDEAMPMSEVLSEEDLAEEDTAMTEAPILSDSVPSQLKQKTLESFFTKKETFSPEVLHVQTPENPIEWWRPGAWFTGTLECA